MKSMPDMTYALVSFERALNNGEVTPVRGTLDPDILVLMDDANGDPRLTYALLDGERVKGIAVYLMTEPCDGHRCFQVGYAVAEQYRRQGIGAGLVRRSIEEMRNGFKRHTDRFVVEAVVHVENVASRALAERVLAPIGTSITDGPSGEPAIHYVRMVECL